MATRLGSQAANGAPSRICRVIDRLCIPDRLCIQVNEDCKVEKQNENMKSAEGQLTKELANQAHKEPGSPQEDEAKERRAQAEKEMANAQNP
jgi:hypothetical protein